jgi:hypothetical protein
MLLIFFLATNTVQIVGPATLQTSPTESVRVRILNENGSERLLASGDTVKLLLTPKGKVDVNALNLAGDTPSRNATAGAYDLPVNCWTNEVKNLMHIGDEDPTNDLASLLVDATLGFTPDGEGLIASAPFDITLIASRFEGSLGSPSSVPNANEKFLRYDIAQTLSDPQKAQARANIGAGTGDGGGSGVIDFTGSDLGGTTENMATVKVQRLFGVPIVNRTPVDGEVFEYSTVVGGYDLVQRAPLKPRVLFVEPNSSFAGTPEIGNPAKPYLTSQAAMNAALAADSEAVIHHGVGNGGGISLSTDWPSSIRLAGLPGSYVGNINIIGDRGTDASDAAVLTPDVFQIGLGAGEYIIHFKIGGEMKAYAITTGLGDVDHVNGTLHLIDSESTPIYADDNAVASAFAALIGVGVAGNNLVTIEGQGPDDVGHMSAGDTGWPFGIGWIQGTATPTVPATTGSSISANITTDGIVQVGSVTVRGGQGGAGSATQVSGYGGNALVTAENLHGTYLSVGSLGQGNDGGAGFPIDGGIDQSQLTITKCAFIDYGAPLINNVCIDAQNAVTNTGNYWQSVNGAPSTNRFM